LASRWLEIWSRADEETLVKPLVQSTCDVGTGEMMGVSCRFLFKNRDDTPLGVLS
jgi:hypothetical protein